MRHLLDRDTATLTLAFEQDILSTNVENLRKELSQTFSDPTVTNGTWQVLYLDLSNIRLIDSAGLNFMVSIIKKMTEKGVQMKALISNANLFRTFKFTRLDKHIQIDYNGGA